MTRPCPAQKRATLSFFLPACGLWSSTLQSPQEGVDSQRRGKGHRERLESGQLAPSRTETAPSPHVQVLEPGPPSFLRRVAQLWSEGRGSPFRATGPSLPGGRDISLYILWGQDQLGPAQTTHKVGFQAEERTVNPRLPGARAPILDRGLSALPTNPLL